MSKKEIFICFIKNCIVLFTAFSISDVLVERFWIKSSFLEMIIRVVLVVILYGAGILVLRWRKQIETKVGH